MLKSQFFTENFKKKKFIEFQISLKYCAKSSTNLVEILTPFIQTYIHISVLTCYNMFKVGIEYDILSAFYPRDSRPTTNRVDGVGSSFCSLTPGLLNVRRSFHTEIHPEKDVINMIAINKPTQREIGPV